MQLWIQAPSRDATTLLNAEDYGFERKNNLTVPEIVITKPEGLLDPCKCAKCARKNACPCRVAELAVINIVNARLGNIAKIRSQNKNERWWTQSRIPFGAFPFSV